MLKPTFESSAKLIGPYFFIKFLKETNVGFKTGYACGTHHPIHHIDLPYLHGQLGTQVPNNYFNHCKVVMQLQQ